VSQENKPPKSGEDIRRAIFIAKKFGAIKRDVSSLSASAAARV
jgi:hypothetical protein